MVSGIDKFRNRFAEFKTSEQYQSSPGYPSYATSHR